MSAPRPQPGILDIAPYVPGDSKAEDARRVIKLSSNESALGPSPKAKAAYAALADQLHRYPDGASADLRAALAEHYGLDAGRIVCGSGSDELINLLIHAYAGAGDEVLYSAHGFLMYPIGALSAGAAPIKAPEPRFVADVDALLSCVTPRTAMVFLANPNNPTGTYVAADEVRRLRAGLPERVLLVIDAAYAEYVVRNDYSPGIELVDAGENVVMTRTFSKIYGLAALRLGWAYCPQAVADVLNRVRGPFNVTLPAQAAGVAALRDVAHTDAARTHNDIWLPWLSAELARLGLEVLPSVGNFVSARFPAEGPRNAKEAFAFLKSRGVLPRPIAAYGMGDFLRFTVGLEEENRAVVATLAEFLQRADG